MNFACKKANFPRLNSTYNKRHAPNIKKCAQLCVHIITGTVVLIRLRKKVDLLHGDKSYLHKR